MSAASRYCNLWRVDPASDRTGYKRCFLPLANDFFQSQGLSEAEEDRGDRSQQRNLQANLLSRFQAPAVDTTERAQAGLCLRCYVSERFSTPATKSLTCSETIAPLLTEICCRLSSMTTGKR